MVEPLIVTVVSVFVLGMIFLFYWKFWFLRQPARKIPEGNVIVSPADGAVVSITPFGAEDNQSTQQSTIEKGWLGLITTITNDVAPRGYLIGIAMNPFNVHYQRAPIDGIVTKIKYTSGRFRNALTSSLRILENEHNEILIEGKIIVKVIQIAGTLARRIKSFVNKKDKVHKGDVIGLINLGSQTILIVPDTVTVKIHKNQRVIDGETIIATLP